MSATICATSPLPRQGHNEATTADAFSLVQRHGRRFSQPTSTQPNCTDSSHAVMTQPRLSQILLLSISFLLASCGGKKENPNKPLLDAMAKAQAEAQKTETERAILAERKEKEQEAKQATKEAAEQALTAPIAAQEFSLRIVPDETIKSSFVVPVDVLTVSSLAADSWRNKSAESYWTSPSPSARKFSFGTKGGATQSPVSLKVPFRSGDTHVVVIVKLNTASEASRPYVYELKRERNDANPLKPIRRPLELRLTAGGLQAR